MFTRMRLCSPCSTTCLGGSSSRSTRWWRRVAGLLGLLVFVASIPAVNEAANGQQAFRPELVAVELASQKVRPGDPLSFTLKFRNAGTAAASRDYRVFTHFEFPEKGCENIAIHADHKPALETSKWEPGAVVVDGPHLFQVPAEAAEGEYFIHLGIYDFRGTGERVLDTYAPVTLVVSDTAPPVAELGPERLAGEEVKQRRLALQQRFTLTDEATLETDSWRFAVAPDSGSWFLEDKKSEVRWTSSTVQPTFGEVMLENGERESVWEINQFDNLAARRCDPPVPTRL